MRDSAKQILLSILGIAIIILAFVGVSYAVFTTSDDDSLENSIDTGFVFLSCDNDSCV